MTEIPIATYELIILAFAIGVYFARNEILQRDIRMIEFYNDEPDGTRKKCKILFES